MAGNLLDPRRLVDVQEGPPTKRSGERTTLARKNAGDDRGAAEAAQEKASNACVRKTTIASVDERAERVDVVGARELPGARETRRAGRVVLDDEHGDDEAERREPGEAREDEGEHEERNRHEDEPARRATQRRAAAVGGRTLEHEHGRRDERRAEQRAEERRRQDERRRRARRRDDDRERRGRECRARDSAQKWSP